MTRKTFLILLWTFALLPVVVMALIYGALPDQVPMNWGLNGVVTYGGKWQMWPLAFINPLMAVLFVVMPQIDPRWKNYHKFHVCYEAFSLFMLLFLLGVLAVVLIEAFRPGTIDVWRVVTMGLGLLFVLLGNIMPKVKNNFFMGIRTPWTLSDPDVWNRANRLGGILLFCLGLVLTVSGLFLAEIAAFVLMLVGVLAVVAVPAAASYIWYRQKHNGDMDKGGDE